MINKCNLRENTNLVDKYFPFNIFNNSMDTFTDNSILGIHWHEHFEIIYLTDGHAVFNIGNQSVTAIPGDIIFVNSGQLHSGYSVDNTYIRYYAIVFGKSMLASQTPDPYHTKYIMPFLENRILFPLKIEKNDLTYNNFKPIVESIINEFNCKDQGYEILIKMYLYSIVVSVIRNYLPLKQYQNKDCMNYKNIDNFIKLNDYIKQHFNEKITVEEAARTVNLSTHHFCRLFKKVTGRTFTEFLNLYRVNEAESLLRNTSLSITDIAEKVGFCNINYFDRIFKQFKRYSPSQCRK